jgi:hypothetical protein
MLTGIAAKSSNLKPRSHYDISGFSIVSQELFDISRQNLIFGNFNKYSYCNVSFSFRDLNESQVHKEI